MKKLFSIAVVLVLAFSLFISGGAVSFAESDAGIPDDNFIPGVLLVGLTKEYSGREEPWTPADFSVIEVSAVELTVYTYGDFLELTVPYTTREELLEAAAKLEALEYVDYAELSGLDEVPRDSVDLPFGILRRGEVTAAEHCVWSFFLTEESDVQILFGSPFNNACVFTLTDGDGTVYPMESSRDGCPWIDAARYSARLPKGWYYVEVAPYGERTTGEYAIQAWVNLSGILGDVDNDGFINSTDARLVLQYVVGKVDAAELNLDTADVDGDGKVTTTDARMILQWSVGKTKFLCGH